MVKSATNTNPQNDHMFEGGVAGFLLLTASIAAIDQNLQWFTWYGTAVVLFGGPLLGAMPLMRPAMSFSLIFGAYSPERSALSNPTYDPSQKFEYPRD
jgi:hypothetical protein